MNTETQNTDENREALGSILAFLISLEKRKITIWQSELRKMPKGTLHLLYRKNKSYFQIAADGSRRGITHDIDLVYRLARKRYLQVLLKERNEALQYAHALSGKVDPQVNLKQKPSSLEKLLLRYTKAGLDLLRITCSEKQYRWVMEKYRKNPFRPEELKFETYSKIKVRSKSEQSIGNSLELRGIPYRYEMEMDLKVDWMDDVTGMSPGGYKKYYPDFVIPLPTGEMLIWEHLGRIDLESYRTHNMEKIAAYRQSGVCRDEYLILTFEKDLENLDRLDQIIANRIMRYM